MNWGTKVVMAIGAFIVFIAGLGIYMIQRAPELETSNYYEKDLHHDQVMQARYNRDALQINLIYVKEKRQVRITYPKGYQQAVGKVFFMRPSDARQDFKVEVKVDSQDFQEISTAPLAAGLWKVGIEWQLNGKQYESRVFEIML